MAACSERQLWILGIVTVLVCAISLTALFGRSSRACLATPQAPCVCQCQSSTLASSMPSKCDCTDEANSAFASGQAQASSRFPTPTGAEGKSVKSVDNKIADSKSTSGRKKKQVFFDLGSNNGDSVVGFLSANPGGALYDGGEGFRKRGGSGEWEIWMFEASPRWTSKLDSVVADLRRQHGHRVTIRLHTATAIGTFDGNTTFFLDVVSGGHHWGSSLLKHHRDVAGGASPITVPIYSLSRLIKSYDIDDTVWVKMDIEGAEFDIVKDLLVKGVVPYIDEFGIEFHTWMDHDKRTDTLSWILKDSGRPVHIYQ